MFSIAGVSDKVLQQTYFFSEDHVQPVTETYLVAIVTAIQSPFRFYIHVLETVKSLLKDADAKGELLCTKVKMEIAIE